MKPRARPVSVPILMISVLQSISSSIIVTASAIDSVILLSGYAFDPVLLQACFRSIRKSLMPISI